MKAQIQCSVCDVVIQTIEKDNFYKSDINDYVDIYLSNPIPEGEDAPKDYVPEYKSCICCNDHPDAELKISDIDIKKAPEDKFSALDSLIEETVKESKDKKDKKKGIKSEQVLQEEVKYGQFKPR